MADALDEPPPPEPKTDDDDPLIDTAVAARTVHWQVKTPADWLIVALGTGLFIGLIPPRVATLGTLLGIPLTLLLHSFVGWTAMIPLLLAMWIVGIYICERSASLLGHKDPRAVVWDEIATVPFVFLYTSSLDLPVLALGFALHRLYDILKLFGAGKLERLRGGWGIMCDDILAAGYALLVMRLLDTFHFWPYLPRA